MWSKRRRGLYNDIELIPTFAGIQKQAACEEYRPDHDQLPDTYCATIAACAIDGWKYHCQWSVVPQWKRRAGGR